VSGKDAEARSRVIWAIALVAAMVAWLAPAAFAADSIYWSRSGVSIRVGNLDGSGTASNLYGGETNPLGVAIDAAAGKIYWANFGSGAIRVANLDGSGTPSTLFPGESGPEGVAINPAAGKIYWANYAGGVAGSGAIRVANLDGTGTASSLFTGENGPIGVAIDPAAGKIYWGDNNNPGAIRVGNLDGTGTASSLFTGESGPIGVAIDPAAGKIYWADNASGAIRFGNLNGSGTASNLFAGEGVPNPWGLAIDPVAGKIYWANFNSGAVRVGNLNGSGTPSNLFTESGPEFLALLRSPVGTGAPQVGGGTSVGSTLSCSQGSWAPDLLGALLYRAPRSFAYQWSLDGTGISGATSNTYTASAPGSYTCRVTATNQAGSTSQTSAAHVVTGAAPAPPPNTKITKAKINQQKHKATFRFKAIGDATGFQCKLRRLHHRKPKATWRRCDSPKHYKHLKPGHYKFKVRAVNHGVKDPTPAHKRFRIR
jgi:hypothetical protein